jgi:hypothetical protein
MTDLVYNASVYTRTVKYTNFKGKTQTAELFFALDPIQLLKIIAGFNPTKSKSRNPAKKDQIEPLSDEAQVEFVQNLSAKAAGFPSDDGESWEPFDGFADSLAGKAFMTQLVSSDSDRAEFAEKVVLQPFRSFVEFAKADPDNTPAEVQNLEKMLTQIESIFRAPDKKESLEERKARLERELETLTQNADEA